MGEPLRVCIPLTGQALLPSSLSGLAASSTVRVSFFCRIYHSQPPFLPVEIQSLRFDQLTDSSGGSIGLEFHLPKSEPGMQISLNEVCIIFISCKYVRDKPVIEVDFSRILQAGQLE